MIKTCTGKNINKKELFINKEKCDGSVPFFRTGILWKKHQQNLQEGQWNYKYIGGKWTASIYIYNTFSCGLQVLKSL